MSKNLSGKQKQFFKKKAHPLKPIVQIGKNGISTEVLEDIDRVLAKRELIKISILQNSDETNETVKEALESIGALVISQIGRISIVFRVASEPKYRDVSAAYFETFGEGIDHDN